MQTILGAGGPIGTELAKALTVYTGNIRLVSRNPKRVNPEDELLAGDLLDYAVVDEAVKGSEVVYLTIGFPYDHKVWERNWPKLISDVIKACKEHDCKLVFFDNAYMYDKDKLDCITESTPVNPSSKKGQVRARIAEMIMQEVWTGKLTALIARSADFYGPGIENNSLLIETVFKPIYKGKKAIWLGSAKYKHSFTYTPDAGKATALLGNTEDAYNQVWHLPTAPNPFTGKQWINEIARQMDRKPGYLSVPKWMVWFMGLFMPIMRETVEMMYQYNRDFVFDSSKFRERFGWQATSCKQAIREIIKADYQKK
ncbi:NAD-dependent epimerase/dehydratase family protein [Salinimicrobium catena]|uniref:NAD-dependent epimerase/dehydratase family protein n=1 Tax=Salinimicrobium catena TaxID=390640 RepID=UPI002FE4F906